MAFFLQMAGIDKPDPPSKLSGIMVVRSGCHAGSQVGGAGSSAPVADRASGQQPGGWFLASGLWIRINAPSKEVIHHMSINKVNCEVVAS